jgi:hypothetical protein
MPAAIGNKYNLGNHNAGQPPKYATPEELAAQIEAYFAYCEGDYHLEKQPVTTGKGRAKKTEMVEVKVWDREPERPMLTRLALFLGFASRQSLYDYGKKEEFSYPISRAMLIIESEYEDLLPHVKGNGIVFALKNFDWKDRKEVETKIVGKTIVRPGADGSVIIEEEDEPETT